MNIGIDLDGVVFDSELIFTTQSALFDFEKNGKGIKIPEELRASKRYCWSKEMEREFLDRYLLKIEQEAPVMPYAKLILNKLKEEGHKLYGITNRGYLHKDEITITLKRLKKEKIKFDDIRFSAMDKLVPCNDFKIDVMIDDYYENIEKVSKEGIKCLYYRDLVLKFIDLENVTEVNNWAKVYLEIKKIEAANKK